MKNMPSGVYLTAPDEPSSVLHFKAKHTHFFSYGKDDYIPSRFLNSSDEHYSALPGQRKIR